ncbi:MAG: HAD-IA family hydrolase [Myxococcota bacterium]|nr:HAD-IA family hydrolase [Myxococcota bacterium]
MRMIALDLDGTLEDSRQDMVESIIRVRQDLNLPHRPAGDFIDHVNRGMAHLYQVGFEEIYRDNPVDDLKLAEVRRRYCEDYEAHIAHHTRLYDGMADALSELGTLATLAVVTNKPEHLSRVLLRRLGVEASFHAIIGGDTCSMGKPSPLPLTEAARRCEASQVIMVGDSIGDIRCARAFGCPVIWCAWGYNGSYGADMPDRIINHPNQLVASCRELFHA